MNKKMGNIDRNLLGIGIIMALVGIKLVLSFFFEGLKTPGELLLSGGLLLIYSFKTFHMRSLLDRNP